jgi:hypothetical protein
MPGSPGPATCGQHRAASCGFSCHGRGGVEKPSRHSRTLVLGEGADHLLHLGEQIKRVAADSLGKLFKIAVERLYAAGTWRTRCQALHCLVHDAPELGAGIKLGAGELSENHQQQGWLDLTHPGHLENLFTHTFHQLGCLRASALDGIAREFQGLPEHERVCRDKLLVDSLLPGFADQHAKEIKQRLGFGLEELGNQLRVRSWSPSGDVGYH